MRKGEYTKHRKYRAIPSRDATTYRGEPVVRIYGPYYRALAAINETKRRSLKIALRRLEGDPEAQEAAREILG